MCKDCGCDHGTSVQIDGKEMHRHHHEHSHAEDVNIPILNDNLLAAERNRGYFEAKGVWVVNVLSSPGSGKTTLLGKTAEMLKGRAKVGIIVGDLATENDAERLRAAGIPVIQITTGTMCHLDAGMIAKAAKEMDLDDLDILIIENVGNLVCPADFDLGENERIVLLSTTEGEDKPLKYPPMFHTANIALITKSDLAEATEFNRDLAMTNLKKIAHHADILEVSSKTGQGMQEWCDLLLHHRSHEHHTHTH